MSGINKVGKNLETLVDFMPSRSAIDAVDSGFEVPTEAVLGGVDCCARLATGLTLIFRGRRAKVCLLPGARRERVIGRYLLDALLMPAVRSAVFAFVQSFSRPNTRTRVGNLI